MKKNTAKNLPLKKRGRPAAAKNTKALTTLQKVKLAHKTTKAKLKLLKTETKQKIKQAVSSAYAKAYAEIAKLETKKSNANKKILAAAEAKFEKKFLKKWAKKNPLLKEEKNNTSAKPAMKGQKRRGRPRKK